jgi:hypothetical protein
MLAGFQGFPLLPGLLGPRPRIRTSGRVSPLRQKSLSGVLGGTNNQRIAVNIAKLPELTRGESPRPPTPEPRAEFVRGGVENWLAQKEAEEATSQPWTFGWAFIAALALIVVGIGIWLAR